MGSALLLSVGAAVGGAVGSALGCRVGGGVDEVGGGVGTGGVRTVDRSQYVYSVLPSLKTKVRPPVTVHSSAMVIGPSVPASLRSITAWMNELS